MRPVTVSVTGVGVSATVVLDYITTPFDVGLATKVTGTVTYTVQHTFDDPFASGWDPSTATWYVHGDSVFVNATANADSNFGFPCRAVRINQTAGTGTTALTVLQGLTT